MALKLYHYALARNPLAHYGRKAPAFAEAGWFGCSVNNASVAERRSIRAFASSFPDEVWVSGNCKETDSFRPWDGPDTYSFDTIEFSFWAKNFDIYEKMTAYIDSIPPRQTEFMLTSSRPLTGSSIKHDYVMVDLGVYGEGPYFVSTSGDQNEFMSGIRFSS